MSSPLKRTGGAASRPRGHTASASKPAPALRAAASHQGSAVTSHTGATHGLVRQGVASTVTHTRTRPSPSMPSARAGATASPARVAEGHPTLASLGGRPATASPAAAPTRSVSRAAAEVRTRPKLSGPVVGAAAGGKSRGHPAVLRRAPAPYVAQPAAMAGLRHSTRAVGGRVSGDTSHMHEAHSTASVEGGVTTVGSASRSPAMSHFQTAGSASTRAVGVATSTVGECFEPSVYHVTVPLQGRYSCVEVVPATATLWAAHAETGELEVYSAVTGERMATLPTGAAVESDGQLFSHASLSAMQERPFASTTSHSAGRRGAVGRLVPNSTSSALPCALKTTATHMWVGFEDGTVAVYDPLVLRRVTEGRFHCGRIAGFTCCSAGDTGAVVSASQEDARLAYWDTEQNMFECLTAFPVPREPGDGALLCLAALPAANDTVGPVGGAADAAQHTVASAARRRRAFVLCGFESGSLYVMDVSTQRHIGTLLQGHTRRINALVAINALAVSASEDGTVIVWDAAELTRDTGEGDGASLRPQSPSGRNRSQPSRAAAPPSDNVTRKLLRRITVRPAVRGLFADEAQSSLWVAYADGLLERWSANVEDDFGVEEVVRELLSRDFLEQHGVSALVSPETQSSAALLHGAMALAALGSVETLQVLALSSNGTNKVWYGHRSTIQDHLTRAVADLDKVIAADTDNTAAWRERTSLLAQKEQERKARYVVLLQQLSEQRLAWVYYERWRRAVLGVSLRAQTRQTIREAAESAAYRLRQRYFEVWARYYDWQRRRRRRRELAAALERATSHARLASVLQRWHACVAQRRVLRLYEASVAVMRRVSYVLLAQRYYRRWRLCAHQSHDRRAPVRGGVEAEATEKVPSASQLAQLAGRAQRQIIYRALQTWYAQYQDSDTAVQVPHKSSAASISDTTTPVPRRATHRASSSALYRYACLYEGWTTEQRVRALFVGWRQWARRRRSHLALHAVAALRGQQMGYLLEQRYYFQWLHFMRAGRVTRQEAGIHEVELQLRELEAQHGDVFERLQLQKQIDKLNQLRVKEKVQLRTVQDRVQGLQDGVRTLSAKIAARRSELGERVGETEVDGLTGSGGGCGGPRSSRDETGAMATMRLNMTVSTVSSTSNSTAMMAPNEAFYRQLVEQQHLSPAVLQHLSLYEGIQHVTAQLKSNVLNLYTDMPLFRQIKDRRRAGVSAETIFSEAFAEVKRVIVTAVRSPAKAGGRLSTRWPLSLTALDSIPLHLCSNVLSAVKTMLVAYDLFSRESVDNLSSTCDEIVANADWLLLISRACQLRRRPILPANNRQLVQVNA